MINNAAAPAFVPVALLFPICYLPAQAVSPLNAALNAEPSAELELG